MLLPVMGLLYGLVLSTQAAPQNENTRWFHDAQYGVKAIKAALAMSPWDLNVLTNAPTWSVLERPKSDGLRAIVWLRVLSPHGL